MPKIRAIHPSFWNDTTLAECSALSRLFFIGVWNFADDAGVFEWHDRLLKSQIFPFDEGVNVDKLLNELVKHNRILSFIHNGKKYGLIVNFPKYQKPDSRYVKYTIGDYEHVKNLSHDVPPKLPRGAPPTDGDGDSDSDSDGEVNIAAAKPRALSRHLYPLLIFVLCRKIEFDNFDQIEHCIKRYAKASKSLQGYTPRQIIAAMLYAEQQSKGEYDVTLETVSKKIIEYKDMPIAKKYEPAVQAIIDRFEKEKDILLSKTSPLIHAK